LSEANRVLSKGGIFILNSYNRGFHPDFLELLEEEFGFEVVDGQETQVQFDRNKLLGKLGADSRKAVDKMRAHMGKSSTIVLIKRENISHAMADLQKIDSKRMVFLRKAAEKTKKPETSVEVEYVESEDVLGPIDFSLFDDGDLLKPTFQAESVQEEEPQEEETQEENLTVDIDDSTSYLDGVRLLVPGIIQKGIRFNINSAESMEHASIVLKQIIQLIDERLKVSLENQQALFLLEAKRFFESLIHVLNGKMSKESKQRVAKEVTRITRTREGLEGGHGLSDLPSADELGQQDLNAVASRGSPNLDLLTGKSSEGANRQDLNAVASQASPKQGHQEMVRIIKEELVNLGISYDPDMVANWFSPYQTLGRDEILRLIRMAFRAPSEYHWGTTAPLSPEEIRAVDQAVQLFKDNQLTDIVITTLGPGDELSPIPMENELFVTAGKVIDALDSPDAVINLIVYDYRADLLDAHERDLKTLIDQLRATHPQWKGQIQSQVFYADLTDPVSRDAILQKSNITLWRRTWVGVEEGNKPFMSSQEMDRFSEGLQNSIYIGAFIRAESKVNRGGFDFQTQVVIDRGARFVAEGNYGETLMKVRREGGINFNPENLNLETRGGGINIPQVDMQQLENMQIDGFVPVIINITPVTNLMMILGLTDDKETPSDGKDSQDQQKISFEDLPAIKETEYELVKVNE